MSPHEIGYRLNETPLSALTNAAGRKYSNPREVFKRLAGSRQSDDGGDTWLVYMLRCADDSLYTGIAKDVNRRLEQHNAGTASRYTRSRLLVTLEYQEEQPSQSMALKREWAIKSLSRKEKEALIESVK